MAERAHMLRALALARRGIGRVEPNPLVGCVLVRGGLVVAEGHHKKFGGPHAEVEALRDAAKRGIDPAGCDAYVTLEPCCHYGKTPPCTDALITAKVGRVVASMVDPFPEVSGRGIARLREAGIAVEVGLCEAEAREVNRAFIKRTTAGLPWVIAKWAQTLDGRIALGPQATPSVVGSPGRLVAPESKWISNEASRRHVHELRARMDAVVAGIGTVLADDPLLTPRPRKRLAWRRTPRRVVIDPSLRIPATARLLQSLPTPLTIAVSQDTARNSPRVEELAAQGVEVFGLPALPDGSRRLDLAPLLRHLATVHDATNVLVEGGATLLGHLFAQQLVDEVLVFIAPKIAGDASAVSAVCGLDCAAMDHALALKPHAMRRFGDDVLLEYRLT